MTPLGPDPLAAGHDLDGLPPGAQPRRSVILCLTPGMRTSMLTEALRRCGAGVPMEYFDIAAVAAPLGRRWRVIDLDGYLAALHHHRSTADGTFGVMLQWAHVRRLHRRVNGITQLNVDRVTTLIETIAPAADVVVVRDGAADAQAVRAALADGGDGSPGPRAVAERLTLISAAQRAWSQWIDAAGVTPLELDVQDGPAFAPALQHLAAALDLPARPALDHPAVDTDPDEAALLARFRADRAAGAVDAEPLPAA